MTASSGWRAAGFLLIAVRVEAGAALRLPRMMTCSPSLSLAGGSRSASSLLAASSVAAVVMRAGRVSGGEGGGVRRCSVDLYGCSGVRKGGGRCGCSMSWCWGRGWRRCLAGMVNVAVVVVSSRDGRGGNGLNRSGQPFHPAWCSNKQFRHLADR